MKLKCPNDECGYVWDYQGDSDFYATCPRCKTSVNIDKNKVVGDD